MENLSFSPCGRFLVAFAGTGAEAPSRVALIRLDQPQEPAHILEHHFPVQDARFSPDGELLAIWCRPQLQLWRTSDLQPVGPPLPVKNLELLGFSPDGRRLVFNPLSSTGVGLLDTSTLKPLRIIPAVGDKHYARFSHDGRMLAWHDWDGTLEIWDVQSGIRPSVTHGLGARASGSAFNPDDSLLAAVSTEGRIDVLRTSNGEVVQVFHVPPYAKANFLTNGILVVSEEAKLVHFWDLAATPLPGSLLSDDALAYAAAFDNSGRFLATGGEGELRLWRMQPSPTLERVVTLPGCVLALTFSEADGQFVAFTDEGTITLVDPETGNATARANCGRGYDLSAALSPDGRKLALFRWGELLAVNTQTGTVQPLNDDAAGTLSVAFKPDSSAMLVGFADWVTMLYHATSKTNALRGTWWSKGWGGWVEDVEFHPGGNLVAAYIGSSGLRLYDSRQKRDIGEIRKLSMSESVMRFSPDGSLLAVAGQTPNGGYAVELWHVDPQRGLFASGVSLPCDQPVWSMAFSPDNQTLVVGGLGTTRLWHLPSVPEDFQEMQARTWATLGFRRDDQGRTVYLDPPKTGNEEVRARITQAPASSVPPLDAALKLAPAEALTALQPLADQHPGTKVYQKLLGRMHAACVFSTADQGLWIEALAHADDAIRLGYDNPEIRYLRALACLGAGDAAGYRATCRDMAARYKSSNDPDVIKWVGWSAALAAGGLDDYRGIIEQMRRAAPRVSGLHGPAYRFYLGAVLLRDGQYQAAADELEQVDRHLKATGVVGVDVSPIYNEFLLAICQAHLGNDAMARQWFDAAQVDVRNLLKPAQGETPTASTTSWNLRLTIRLLQEEAEGLLNTSAPQPSPSQ